MRAPGAELDIGGIFATWHHLVETGELREEGLREHVARAWQRALASGCHPHATKVHRLTDEEVVRLLERERALIEAAWPYVLALSRAGGDQRHAAILADRHGHVLGAVGDEDSLYGPHAVPGPGALLSEAVVGANGIGTPLAEGSYVDLVGPENFLADFHGFTCQGLPLCVEGQVVGALGMWVRRPETAWRVHDILVCAARGIEAELLARRLWNAAPGDAAPGAATSGRAVSAHDDRPLEELRQDIVQLQAAARLRFEVAAQLRGQGRDTVELLVAAERLIQTFQERAALWRDLVDEELVAPCAVLLNEYLDRFVAMLGKEAESRGVVIERTPATTPVVAQVDPRALSRSLLHVFLRALDIAEDGGRVSVTLESHASQRTGVIRLVASGQTRRGEFSVETPVGEGTK